MPGKNYYVILGIPVNSDQTEIKAAYRRLAKEYHPDHYGANQAPFQDIQEAYTILSDPKRRRSYDASRQYQSAGRPAPHHVEPMYQRGSQRGEPLAAAGATSFPGRASRGRRPTVEPMYGLYDKRALPKRRQQAVPLPNNLTVEIVLSEAEAREGGDLRLRLPVQTICPACAGLAVAGSLDCLLCHGAGLIVQEKTLQLYYPAGIRQNHIHQFTPAPSTTGALHVTVVFKIGHP